MIVDSIMMEQVPTDQLFKLSAVFQHFKHMNEASGHSKGKR